MQFAISVAAAAATPAIAAGLVAGTSVAMEEGNKALTPDFTAADQTGADAAVATSQEATHGPARLSVLVGNDQASWDSAHSVHVNFTHKPR